MSYNKEVKAKVKMTEHKIIQSSHNPVMVGDHIVIKTRINTRFSNNKKISRPPKWFSDWSNNVFEPRINNLEQNVITIFDVLKRNNLK
ncbi:MAG: hypothetical protein LBF36_00590 [Mycoplasmataceae bacterium]|nr:hypothetical protein [Mycoplasmataceae bacterium]